MKKKLLIILLIFTISVNPLNATTGTLKSASIIECDGVLYGTHGSDNHYHIAEETENGKYKAKGDSLGSNWTCKGTIKDPKEDQELESVTAEFDSCVDGDTAVFKINGVKTKFRFLAIDTPETVHPTKGVEEYGKNASEYTCNKLKTANKIEIEYEESKIDKYGRSLGWIWVNDSLLQDELVKSGYAEVAYIYGDYKYTKSLCETQKSAILEQNGIWADGKREEGYCSTLRKVETNTKTLALNKEETTITDENNKNYTKEIIGVFAFSVLAIFIKLLKK